MRIQKEKQDQIFSLFSKLSPQLQDSSIQSLQRANIVDRACKQMMDNVCCPLTVLGCDQLGLFVQLDVESSVGTIKK